MKPIYFASFGLSFVWLYFLIKDWNCYSILEKYANIIIFSPIFILSLFMCIFNPKKYSQIADRILGCFLIGSGIFFGLHEFNHPFIGSGNMAFFSKITNIIDITMGYVMIKQLK